VLCDSHATLAGATVACQRGPGLRALPEPAWQAADGEGRQYRHTEAARLARYEGVARLVRDELAEVEEDVEHRAREVAAAPQVAQREALRHLRARPAMVTRRDTRSEQQAHVQLPQLQRSDSNAITVETWSQICWRKGCVVLHAHAGGRRVRASGCSMSCIWHMTSANVTGAWLALSMRCSCSW
jgi:hypothetical protein